MMTITELQSLQSGADRIKRLDEMMAMLSRKPEDKLDELGEKIISVLGRNALSKRADWVGAIAWVAIFNAILDEREGLRAELSGRVEIPQSEHLRQKIGEFDD